MCVGFCFNLVIFSCSVHLAFVFSSIFLFYFFQIPVRHDLESGPLGPYFLSGKHVFPFSFWCAHLHLTDRVLAGTAEYANVCHS